MSNKPLLPLLGLHKQEITRDMLLKEGSIVQAKNELIKELEQFEFSEEELDKVILEHCKKVFKEGFPTLAQDILLNMKSILLRKGKG